MSFGRARILVLVIYVTLAGSSMWAQDLGPHFRKIKEGIYVQSAREVNSNSGIILTKEGVVINRHGPDSDRFPRGGGGGQEADRTSGSRGN